MKRIVLSSILLLATLLSCTQCSDRNAGSADGYGRGYPHTKEAITIIDSCMSFMQTDPARSHRIIDSICQARLMRPARCDYYHAIVVYMGDERRDSALAICNRLLDEGQFGDDRYLEEELCVLASNITLTLGRFVQTLEYANRGIAICHGQSLMNADEAMLLGRAGQAEQKLGRTEEAMQTYQEANRLLMADKTFGGLIARISLMMKQATFYYETAQYDRMIDTCHAVLALVEGFHRNPTPVENRPQTMATSGQATRDFADFYQSQMYGKIARAYLDKAEQGSPDSASACYDSLNLYLDRWEQTQSHTSPDNLARVLRPLFVTGRTAPFDEAKLAVAELYRGDSIVAEYADCLAILAQEAASRNDYQTSNAYLHRALVIGDSLRRKESLRALSEQLALHITQQQQLNRQEARARASRHRLIITLIVLAIASAVAIALLRRRNKQKEDVLQMTQQDLIETREEVNDMIQQLEESRKEKIDRNQQELYDRIELVVREKKLYLHPNFNIAMLAEHLGTNRTFISACINSLTGKTFRTWLAEYRLQLFIQKQSKTPDTPIDQLLTQCGYKDQSTFRRQFKAAFGTTPSKYKNTTENENTKTEE